jgi:hypothetical protein
MLKGNIQALLFVPLGICIAGGAIWLIGWVTSFSLELFLARNGRLRKSVFTMK